MVWVVDYRGLPGIQDGGLEGRPKMFSVVDYMRVPRYSTWRITGEASGVQHGRLQGSPDV